MLSRDDLTPAQQAALDKWWDEHEDEDFDCLDNTRYARQGNAAEEAEYEKIVALGCCGFLDVELPCEDGSVLMFGFNYGH